jgi:nucleotide-binding universal stress UspA family protein
MSKLKVLVATDGSDESARACELLARTAGETPIHIRVLTVLSFTYYPSALVPGDHVPGTSARERAVDETVTEATSEARVIFERARLSNEVSHRFGNPADEILDEADEWGADLVVIGRRGLRGVGRVLGSVSDHVIHRAHVPVLVVP